MFGNIHYLTLFGKIISKKKYKRLITVSWRQRQNFYLKFCIKNRESGFRELQFYEFSFHFSQLSAVFSLFYKFPKIRWKIYDKNRKTV